MLSKLNNSFCFSRIACFLISLNFFEASRCSFSRFSSRSIACFFNSFKSFLVNGFLITFNCFICFEVYIFQTVQAVGLAKKN